MQMFLRGKPTTPYYHNRDRVDCSTGVARQPLGNSPGNSVIEMSLSSAFLGWLWHGETTGKGQLRTPAPGGHHPPCWGVMTLEKIPMPCHKLLQGEFHQTISKRPLSSPGFTLWADPVGDPVIPDHKAQDQKHCCSAGGWLSLQWGLRILSLGSSGWGLH